MTFSGSEGINFETEDAMAGKSVVCCPGVVGSVDEILCDNRPVQIGSGLCSDCYGRSRLRFGISELHGGGRLAFSSVRPVRFAAVRAEGSSRNAGQLHNSVLVRCALLMLVIVGGAW